MAVVSLFLQSFTLRHFLLTIYPFFLRKKVSFIYGQLLELNLDLTNFSTLTQVKYFVKKNLEFVWMELIMLKILL